MAQRWFFCTHCYQDRIFEWVYKSHGLFGGGHEDWHCTACGSCEDDPVRNH